ncbi:hypothetical protein GMORB2_0270 [Geosmithia morbida]|uniref:Uncharacterized protein n=1 Tax=Geosmithia morbida TaxID=1094350 RepID=A0A9P4Z331_9HYPO|nr:uncharacterized protein GMORB2_0270 [Geosmithia morbida]KAF4126534.1 hypothetical protein GMORB2_0270 [Geosmithia morbida]
MLFNSVITAGLVGLASAAAAVPQVEDLARRGNDTAVIATKVITEYTTFCPGPTTVSRGTKTWTVTEATTLTFTDCDCEATPTPAHPGPPGNPGLPVTPGVPVTPGFPGTPPPAVPTYPAGTPGPSGVPPGPSGVPPVAGASGHGMDTLVLGLAGVVAIGALAL